MNLSHSLDRDIVFNGRRYRLNLAFDNVLRMLEMQKDGLFLPHERLSLSLEMLAGRQSARLPLDAKEGLLNAIVGQFINVYKRPRKPGAPRVLDFEQDAGMIYAAFRQAYGIDLLAELGRMDWRVFIALIYGLPEDTEIREIIAIRGREIPAPTKYNTKEIAALMEAKAYYALRVDPEDAEEAFQAGIDRLAASLEARARHEIS